VDSQAIDEVVKLLRLYEYVNHRASQLSGGMQRKLMLASALLGHPDVLLLDDPTVDCDADSARAAWKYL